MPRRSRPDASGTRSSAGLTLVELAITIAVLGILASVALPYTKLIVKRTKESELRTALREMRVAIDRYKEDRMRANPGPEATLYPKTLDVLLDAHYLRRIPRDPMTGETEWLTLSTSDDRDTESSDGLNVWDVRTRSDDQAIDGTKYRSW